MKKHYPKEALSPLFIKHVKEPGFYADGNCLFLLVDKDLCKRWIQRLVVNGKRHDIGLGAAQYTTLVEARETARVNRKLARSGGDPMEARRIEKAKLQRAAEIPTFEQAAKLVHAEKAKSFRNPRHAMQWIATLEQYAYPIIGKKRVSEIESDLIHDVLEPIWTKIPETARRVKQRMAAVFNWARTKRYREGANPVEGVTDALTSNGNKKKHFPALPYAQVSDFIAELEFYNGPSARLAFEFMILTAARTGEVRFAEWTEIDLDARVWRRPADHMKAKEPHEIPLAPRCLEILEEARSIADGGRFIFPGFTSQAPFSGACFHSVIAGLDKKFSDKHGEKITPHGFRSTFRDWAEDRTHFSRAVIESALAHSVKNKVEAAYNRTDHIEKRTELMAAWAAFCAATASGKVIPMRA